MNTRASSLQSSETADEFAARISKLSSNDRVAAVKIKMREVAERNGWHYDPKMSRMSRRDVYKTPTGDYRAVDTQHGTLEYTNRKGQHQGEFKIDGEHLDPRDKTDRHDLDLNQAKVTTMIRLVDHTKDLARGDTLYCAGPGALERALHFMIIDWPTEEERTFALMTVSGANAGRVYSVPAQQVGRSGAKNPWTESDREIKRPWCR